MSRATASLPRTIGAHAVLLLYTAIALFPVFLTIINSFKSRNAIFRNPMQLPTPETFDLVGYVTVLGQGDFANYFQNSLIVTVVSIFLVLLFGAMAAFALSEYRIFFRLVLPLVRPSMATVAVFTMIPIWNDLWFPLILAPSEATKTVTLGAQLFIGQYVTNWNAVLAALSLAIFPVLVLYLIFSRQLIRGITSGAVK